MQSCIHINIEFIVISDVSRSVITGTVDVLLIGLPSYAPLSNPGITEENGVCHIFAGTEQNGNGTEIAVGAYLDYIHEFVSITFIVFIGNTHLPGAPAYYCNKHSLLCIGLVLQILV